MFAAVTFRAMDDVVGAQFWCYLAKINLLSGGGGGGGRDGMKDHVAVCETICFSAITH